MRHDERDSDLTVAMTRASSTPRHLRMQAKVSQSDMAHRMRIAPTDLRTLEDTSIGLWEVSTLRAYLLALGYEMRVVAVQGEKEEVVS
jgi:hypothetical protein